MNERERVRRISGFFLSGLSAVAPGALTFSDFLL